MLIEIISHGLSEISLNNLLEIFKNKNMLINGIVDQNVWNTFQGVVLQI